MASGTGRPRSAEARESGGAEDPRGGSAEPCFLCSRVPGSPVVVGFLQRNRLVLSCLLALLDNTSGSVVELAAGSAEGPGLGHTPPGGGALPPTRAGGEGGV